jgi:hypothetical protein
MTPAVVAVCFDHARGHPDSITIPLRYDLSEAVSLPEWARGQRTPSVAAYCLDRLPATVFVLVRFAASPGQTAPVQIRAVARPSPGSPTIGQLILPNLTPQQVNFAAGDSGWIPFAFDAASLTFGVNAGTFEWVWQIWLDGSQAWADFDVSSHRLYVLAAAPTAPWRTTPARPDNLGLPRVDLLDHACRWAYGARTPDEVAQRITGAIHDLGGATFVYDAVVGAPHYSVLGAPLFLCDAFIDRLRGGEGAGGMVNCSDCATLVSTVANLLGADLWQSKMGLIDGGFLLNPILSIGLSDWSTLFGGFTFHEVAWSGQCGNDDLVYDACCMVDADADPTSAPHTARLPTGERFGAPGDDGYRDRIAAPQSRNLCEPRPALRVRRSVEPFVMGTPSRRLPATLRRELSGRMAQPRRDMAGSVHFEGFDVYGQELPGWSLTRRLRVEPATRPTEARMRSMAAPAGSPRIVVSFWRNPVDPDSAIRIESIETPNSADVQDQLAEVLAQIENPDLQPSDSGPGEARMRLSNGSLELFTRGNHVHILRSIGRHPTDVGALAERLDDWLMAAGDAEDSPIAALTSPMVPGWSRIVSAPELSLAPQARAKRFLVTPLSVRR